MSKARPIKPQKPSRQPRSHKMVILLSDEEKQLIENYIRKYRISNKSRWMRESLLYFIRQNMATDYPTLFEETLMRR